MEDKKPFDLLVELAKLDQLIPLNEFFSINIWPRGENPEIRIQGYLNSETKAAAKTLGIELVYDNEDGFLRGSNGIVKLVLSAQ
jgi:hypothetical protein